MVRKSQELGTSRRLWVSEQLQKESQGTRMVNLLSSHQLNSTRVCSRTRPLMYAGISPPVKNPTQSLVNELQLNSEERSIQKLGLSIHSYLGDDTDIKYSIACL